MLYIEKIEKQSIYSMTEITGVSPIWVYQKIDYSVTAGSTELNKSPF